MLFGGIEAGGTKIDLVVGTGPDDLRAARRISTGRPEEAIPAMLRFFEDAQAEHGMFDAIGIATFGPAVLDRADPRWGWVVSPVKPNWEAADLAGPFARRFGVPVAFDTDVGGAALAELRWGAGRGLDTLLYLTVGTGIGGGVVIGGRVHHGLAHPEVGHMRLRRHPEDDFAGVCDVHGDCVEGMASGPAILSRCGAPLNELPADHPARGFVADQIGQLCANLVLTLGPQKILIGGGVMNAGALHVPIAERMRAWLAGYVTHPAVMRDDYVAPPGLGGRAGALGALALAESALQQAGT